MQVTSSSKKRRYVVQGVAAASLIGLAATGVALSLPAEAEYKASDGKQDDRPGAVEGEAATLDVDTYLGVQRLRRELCLNRGDLAAMGCDTATAKTLLERLIQVHQSRRANVIAARNAVLSAKAALFRAQREGSREGGSMPPAELEQLGTDYEDAVLAYHTLLEGLATEMAAGLSEDQRDLWSAARASERDGRPSELRYAVDMTEGQLDDMRTPGSDAQGRPLSPVEAADLRLTQELSIEQARANHAASYSGIVRAEEYVLPVPPDLIEEEAGVADDELIEDGQ